ncbi:MAG: ABC transporter permease [Arachidicoccus sp.]|nr:ABC transporter permease [Arachidicoccus sp.]
MNKILLIIKREFLSRVQKRSFLLLTIGLPVLIGGLYALIIYFAVKSNNKIVINVADNAHFFRDSLPSNDENISFVFAKNQPIDSAETLSKNSENTGLIVIQQNADILKDGVEIMLSKKIGYVDKEKVRSALEARLKQMKLASIVTDTAILHQLQSPAKVSFVNYTDTKDGVKNTEDKSDIATGVGFASGFLIYIVLLVYGMMVLRGVMEEKVNRIAEVIISSVKPFQLMMGKIIGIGLVGLLQFLIWIVLTIFLKVLVPMFFAKSDSGAAASIHSAMSAISDINFALIIPVFLIYFLGGYFLYASLFAAIGSTVSDGQQDLQGLQLPVTLPIIFGFVIMTQAINNPTSGLSVFGSIFPLTSPVVMIARVTQGIPDAVSYPELIISIVLLFATFLFTTWFAGKIYRTGILMYGKKTTWKELMKWALRKS